MKKSLLFLYVCACALGTACNDSGEPVLPRPTEQTADVGDKTTVSEADAVRVAEAFFLNQDDSGLKTRSAAGALKTPASIQAIEADAGSPAMHVINYPGGGWAIVSATRDYHPVLAFSDEGSFELSADMGPVDVWISETKEAIRSVTLLEPEAKASISAEWARLEPENAALAAQVSTPKTRSGYYEDQMDAAYRSRMSQLYNQYQGEWTLTSLASMAGSDYFVYGEYDEICNIASLMGSPVEYCIVGFKNRTVATTVGPLMTTQWHQYEPFNGACNNNAAGCGTIAVGQILKFFEDAGSSSYDWDRVFDNPPTGDGLPPGFYDELCRFVKEVGNTLNINYNTNHSGVNVNDIKNAFSEFNYIYTENGHSASDVRTWLSNERAPVCMTGSTGNFLGLPTGDGHVWVCDGYRKSEYRTEYFVEFIHPQYFEYMNDSRWTINNPGESVSNIASYFHMKWGFDLGTQTRDGWFGTNSVNTSEGNFQHVRRNIYAKPR